MRERIHATVTRAKEEEPSVAEITPAEPNGDLLEKSDSLLDEIDALLDDNSLDALLNEVDLVLEPNAAEFAQLYQQRGGE